MKRTKLKIFCLVIAVFMMVSMVTPVWAVDEFIDNSTDEILCEDGCAEHVHVSEENIGIQPMIICIAGNHIWARTGDQYLVDSSTYCDAKDWAREYYCATLNCSATELRREYHSGSIRHTYPDSRICSNCGYNSHYYAW